MLKYKIIKYKIPQIVTLTRFYVDPYESLRFLR